MRPQDDVTTGSASLAEPRPSPAAVPAPKPVRFPVGPVDGPADAWEVAADLYLPDSPASTVQVLLPGLTYDRRYWTLPEPYNYAHHLCRAGYAVLAMDRIGTGASTRPPSEQVCTDNHVHVLHQIVQALRKGEHTDVAFDRVITVGHSYGSGIAIVEAARHQDVDGVVVSGMLHATTPLYEKVRAFFHHASEDPILAPKAPPGGWPEWYMTQRPGYRARMLEHADTIDPEISAHNEQIKATATLGEGESLPMTYEAAYSRAIKVPVLVVVGEHDALFGGEGAGFPPETAAVHAFEESFYAPEARLETHVLPGAGHSLNLHRNATDWFEIVRKWADRL
ncbi:alpha/beta hydrolase [Actinomadura rubrobrunea]|uniref:Alpha/beta hydrolase n=1 Tax=Actinomadura rubrobrunea TaxID=115335 RepID=A0A9W6UWQ9_9ACTN|nr:alpha/beta fold hydrolase [Actinomadura rubrobrunea]GLW66946.1 alpha/beta hydrolase [Actinomadura rubrobrunea]